jgi:hypothetical protein
MIRVLLCLTLATPAFATKDCRRWLEALGTISQYEQIIREDVPRIYVDEGPYAAAELHEDLLRRIREIQRRLNENEYE